jgi:peptide deformylase
MILDILTAPHPILSTKAEPVRVFDAELSETLNNMLETMYHAHGIGLAANQIGLLKRMIVIDVNQSEGERGTPIKLVNPVIRSCSDELSSYNEGCLSFPGQYADVIRPKEVEIEYQDETGKAHTLAADDLLATCIQHEIDHLDGIVFVDHISRLKRDMIMRRLRKLQPVED